MGESRTNMSAVRDHMEADQEKTVFSMDHQYTVLDTEDNTQLSVGYPKCQKVVVAGRTSTH